MAITEAGVKDLVTYLVTSLVDDTDAVSVASEQTGSTVAITISVASDDIGKIIGRQGRIIKAIRTMARAAGSQSNLNVEVEVDG